MGLQFVFDRRTWVWKGLKFRFSGVKPGFGPFAAELVRSLSVWEGLK